MYDPIPDPVPPAIEWHKTKPYKKNQRALNFKQNKVTLMFTYVFIFITHCAHQD